MSPRAAARLGIAMRRSCSGSRPTGRIAADDDANISWARELFGEASALSPGGTYLNFPGFVEEGEELLRATYGGNYERLQEVKARSTTRRTSSGAT